MIVGQGQAPYKAKGDRQESELYLPPSANLPPGAMGL
jgi:hypothetical protein